MPSKVVERSLRDVGVVYGKMDPVRVLDRPPSVLG